MLHLRLPKKLGNLIPLAIFTYNFCHYSSTKMSPFVVNFGYHSDVVILKTPTLHQDATDLFSEIKITVKNSV